MDLVHLLKSIDLSTWNAINPVAIKSDLKRERATLIGIQSTSGAMADDGDFMQYFKFISNKTWFFTYS